MKKLTLLSLIFTALVFQSCKKVSYDTDGDLVPIVFSLVEITKGAVVANQVVVDALVLGSDQANNWSELYSSTASGSSSTEPNYAKGRFTFSLAPPTPNDYISIDNKFNPIVVYPFHPPITAPVTIPKYIHIKALAPITSIDGWAAKLENKSEGITDNKVNVTIIDGQQDIMVTKATTLDPHLTSENHGCGTRSNPLIKLEFEHLLSKINFYLEAESSSASSFWGAMKNLTFKGGHTSFELDLISNKLTLRIPSTPIPFIINKGPRDIPVSTTVALDKTLELHYSVMVYPVETWEIEVNTLRYESKLISFKTTKLEQGREYNITLTFNSERQIVITKEEVAAWGKPVDSGSMEIK